MVHPELTIFTCPKGFHDQFYPIQTNAIRSWKALADVVLLGQEDGVEAAVDRLHVHWSGQSLKTNAYGTPLLSDIFAQGQTLAKTDLVAFVNADILLFNDFLEAVKVCASELPHFLICGQRKNVETGYSEYPLVDYGLLTAPQYFANLKGTLEGIGASDYFVWRKGDLGDIPPFAIGRFRWDNWLMWRALNLNMALVDATDAVLAVHQNHTPMPRVEGDVERIANDTLVSQNGGILGRLSDATHYLDANFQLHERVQA